MRLPRVYQDQPLVPDAELRLTDGTARHLTQVLRLGVGDSLLCFNGDGRDHAARVASIGRRGTFLTVGEPGELESTPALSIYLALGVSRGERMDYAIQKAVELGVMGIRPLFTERSMVQLTGERLTRRMEHWQGIVIGACEQSGRRLIPGLDPALGLADWLATGPVGVLLLDPAAPQGLAQLGPPESAVTLLVGPEGGLSPKERNQAAAQGVRGVRLGPRILRAETAPLAAIAALQALWGDFRD